MNKELLEKAKECKSIEEILTLAKNNGVDLTEAEAKNFFAQWNPTNGELADSELETVAGGCGGSDEIESTGSPCAYCGASADTAAPAKSQTIPANSGIQTPRPIGPVKCPLCGRPLS